MERSSSTTSGRVEGRTRQGDGQGVHVQTSTDQPTCAECSGLETRVANHTTSLCHPSLSYSSYPSPQIAPYASQRQKLQPPCDGEHPSVDARVTT
mmetsp:Transcript_51163/g.120096  ORF Transcript_51163/g.120096 Transcript_51163/m.120096 type:complete len:95 (+) Transcript_51163:742-1026(+)